TSVPGAPTICVALLKPRVGNDVGIDEARVVHKDISSSRGPLYEEGNLLRGASSRDGHRPCKLYPFVHRNRVVVLDPRVGVVTKIGFDALDDTRKTQGICGQAIVASPNAHRVGGVSCDHTIG